MLPIIKFFLSPFFILISIIYFIFGKLTGVNNYYIIAKNTATCYNILKLSNQDFIFSERDILFISGIADAFNYIRMGDIKIDEIYILARDYNNLEDFMFEFIKLLLTVDNGKDYIDLAHKTDKSFFYKSITRGINNSKAYDKGYDKLIGMLLVNPEIANYLDCYKKIKQF